MLLAIVSLLCFPETSELHMYHLYHWNCRSNPLLIQSTTMSPWMCVLLWWVGVSASINLFKIILSICLNSKIHLFFRFLKFNIHRNQKLRCASAREVAATAVLPPSFVGEVAAMCCFKLPDACGGNLWALLFPAIKIVLSMCGISLIDVLIGLIIIIFSNVRLVFQNL